MQPRFLREFRGIRRSLATYLLMLEVRHSHPCLSRCGHHIAHIWSPLQAEHRRERERRKRKREREKTKKKTWGKKCVWEPRGDAPAAPAKNNKARGPLWPGQILATRKNQTGGGLSPSAREGHSTPYPHSGRGSGRDHPRAGLPASRCKAH